MADAEMVAKLLKNLSQFEVTAIMRSVMAIPEKDQRQLRRTAGTVLDGVSNRSVTMKKRPSRRVVASKEDKFINFLTDIERSLWIYEKGDLDNEVDQLVLDLSFIGQIYEEVVTDLKKAAAIHSELLAAGKTAQRIRLLAFFERGRLYQFLRENACEGESWTVTCETLGIKRPSAARFEAFCQIIQALPRLLTTELDMTSIMINFRKLKQHLGVHTVLRDRLRKPMREIDVSAKGCRIRRQLLPQGTAEVPEYDERSWDWTDRWEASDELQDASMIDEEALLGLTDDDDEYQDVEEDLSSKLDG